MRNAIRFYLAVGLLASCAAAPASTVEDDPAAQLCKQADELVKQGKLDEAMKTYASAAKTDRTNMEYRQQYALMRQVIKLRDALPKEENPVKWQTGAQGLRAFYVGNALYKDALPLDQQLHEKLNTAETAQMLAETLLNLNKNAEAAKFVAALDEEKKNAPALVALCGIAAARLDQKDQAQATLSGLKLPEEPNPSLLMTVARLQALLGMDAAACASLSQSLENTPETRMAEPIAYAQACPDFAAIKKSDAFAAALKTESKVKVSGCSGGSSCGSCSLKGSCSSSAGCSSAAQK